MEYKQCMHLNNLLCTRNLHVLLGLPRTQETRSKDANSTFKKYGKNLNTISCIVFSLRN